MVSSIKLKKLICFVIKTQLRCSH